MTTNKIKILKTKDGSDTIVNETIQETYHSVNGAISESEHIYINNGLKYFTDKSNIDIFEMGFGTGMNAFLTLIETQKSNFKVNYTAIEKFLITEEQSKMLNYSQIKADFGNLFAKIHSCHPDFYENITDNFKFRLINDDILNYKFDAEYDIFYFDAFSYNSQPELWSEEMFRKIFNATKTNGILLTYSAKGIVKENLRKAGFFVKRIKGFQKHHSILAIKTL